MSLAELVNRFTPLAKKMVKEALPNIPLLDEEAIIDGLIEMSKKGYLNATGKLPTISQVESAVRKIQKDSAGVLKVDKIFGLQTAHWLKFVSRCHGQMKKIPKGQNKRNASTFTAKEVRYFIRSLPPGTDTFDPEILLKNAWHSWRVVCGVEPSRCWDENEANVIVFTDDIDGPSNVLADAHVGPVGGSQALELRIDKAESWTPKKFEAAICHEIGHLLGLDHSSVPNSLMNTHVGDITTPQKDDITKVKKLKWGESTYTPPVDF